MSKDEDYTGGANESARSDEDYMRHAIDLAKQGAGLVAPNPMVGAVIVKNGVIIGEGYHERYGDLHAERNALKNCKGSAQGSTLYVTLEPCCHYGKQPPCTEAILESGIERVVIGTLDVNPKVAGKGAAILKEHGIKVEVGLLEKECRFINRSFNKFMSRGLPYVVMKYAMTADGKIATSTGESKWITGEETRKQVHILRKNLSGIMVGVSTVIMDDPMLDCRLGIENFKNPTRIVCDSHLQTPLDSKLVQTAKEIDTIIATVYTDDARVTEYEKRGCTVLQVPKSDEGIDLKALLKALAKRGIDSILLEGGGTLNYSALQAHIVDEVHVHIGTKLFGGAGKSPVEGMGVEHVADAFQLEPVGSRWCQGDLIVECLVSQR